ncbi:MAG: NAD(P)(+) transhydrogenase (Re/Si-specific) subunit alpha, partial [Gemmatimonadetes bacterium]|nr:NAD(P)(+) transhydrogenase (Re/Si-specific) subunit alpha [Gemmatimonadota bacterium]
MKVGVPREVVSGERRVALVPDGVAKLVDRGLEVVVEAGAGVAAGFADAAYQHAGARVADAAAAWGADVVLKVAPPGLGTDGLPDEAGRLREGAALIGFLLPLTSPQLVRRLAERKATSFSMELVPRITVAQRMDA